MSNHITTHDIVLWDPSKEATGMPDDPAIWKSGPYRLDDYHLFLVKLPRSVQLNLLKYILRSWTSNLLLSGSKSQNENWFLFQQFASITNNDEFVELLSLKSKIAGHNYIYEPSAHYMFDHDKYNMFDHDEYSRRYPESEMFISTYHRNSLPSMPAWNIQVEYYHGDPQFGFPDVQRISHREMIPQHILDHYTKYLIVTTKERASSVPSGTIEFYESFPDHMQVIAQYLSQEGKLNIYQNLVHFIKTETRYRDHDEVDFNYYPHDGG